MGSLSYIQRLLIVIGIIILFFFITAVCLPLSMKFCGISDNTRDGYLILALIQAFLLFIIPSFVCARVISRNPIDFLELNRAPGWMPVLGVVFAYLIALPALNQLIYWNQNISFPEGWADFESGLRGMEAKAQATSDMMLNITDFGGMLVNLLVIGLVTAFAEEIFFRGTLQRTFASSGAVYVSIWIVAFLFSFVHLQFFGFFPRLILGAWFGYLLYWTRSLYVPFLAHFINNGVVVVCLWISARNSDFDFDLFGVATEGFPIAACVSAIATAVFLIFFRKTFFFPHSVKN